MTRRVCPVEPVRPIRHPQRPKAGDDLAADFVDYPYPDKRRVRELMQTGITVASPGTPATEVVQPMAKHRNKRKPILNAVPPIAYGAVGAT